MYALSVFCTQGVFTQGHSGMQNQVSFFFSSVSGMNQNIM